MSEFKANKYLKADARESLIGNLTTPVVSTFLYSASTMLLSEMIANFSSGSVLIAILLSVVIFLVVNTCANMLRIGLSCIFLKLQFRQPASIGDLLFPFRNNSDAAVTISACIAVLELLCMLPYILFIAAVPKDSIPAFSVLSLTLLGAGFLGTYAVRIRYAMCIYLYLDFPDLTAAKLIRGGTRLIKGSFVRLLSLSLSFLPLHVLSLLSLGIAGLWVSSYAHAAEAAFYKDLMANTSF